MGWIRLLCMGMVPFLLGWLLIDTVGNVNGGGIVFGFGEVARARSFILSTHLNGITNTDNNITENNAQRVIFTMSAMILSPSCDSSSGSTGGSKSSSTIAFFSIHGRNDEILVQIPGLSRN